MLNTHKFIQDITQRCKLYDATAITELDLLEHFQDLYNDNYLIHTESQIIVGLMLVRYYDEEQGVVIEINDNKYSPISLKRSIEESVFQVLLFDQVLLGVSS